MLLEGLGQQDYSGCCVKNRLNGLKRKGRPISGSCSCPGGVDGDLDQGGCNGTVEKLLT